MAVILEWGAWGGGTPPPWTWLCWCLSTLAWCALSGRTGLEAERGRARTWYALALICSVLALLAWAAWSNHSG